jgi:hypothetical protein
MYYEGILQRVDKEKKMKKIFDEEKYKSIISNGEDFSKKLNDLTEALKKLDLDKGTWKALARHEIYVSTVLRNYFTEHFCKSDNKGKIIFDSAYYNKWLGSLYEANPVIADYSVQSADVLSYKGNIPYVDKTKLEAYAKEKSTLNYDEVTAKAIEIFDDLLKNLNGLAEFGIYPREVLSSIEFSSKNGVRVKDKLELYKRLQSL